MKVTYSVHLDSLEDVNKIRSVIELYNIYSLRTMPLRPEAKNGSQSLSPCGKCSFVTDNWNCDKKM